MGAVQHIIDELLKEYIKCEAKHGEKDGIV